jgi:hypothetical protein
VRISERETVPTDRFESDYSEDAIYHAESRFQVWVSFVTDDRVPARDRIEYFLVEFVTHALALNGDVEKGLCAEVGLVSKLGDQHRAIV